METYKDKQANNDYYTVLPSKIRLDNRLTGDEKILYSEILALSKKQGFCFAKNKYFCDLYGIDKRTVTRRIKTLVKLGYIKIDYIYHDGTKYIEKRKIYISDFNDIKKSISNYDNEIDSILVGDFKVDDNNFINKFVEKWNDIEGVESISKSNLKHNNLLLDRLVSSYGEHEVIGAIDKINYSNFLRGNKKGSEWRISLPWFLELKNFKKVFGGNYTDMSEKEFEEEKRKRDFTKLFPEPKIYKQ